jgi:hypothetical protein
MRWIFGLVALLIAVAIALSLSARSARRSFDAVKMVAPALREGVPASDFDESESLRLADRLEELSGVPDLPSDELREATAICASWAAGVTPGSGAYRAAVKLRAAADGLLAASDDLGDPHRQAARRAVLEARRALASPAAQPGGPAGAIRDQLENVQLRHREQLEEVEKQDQ